MRDIPFRNRLNTRLTLLILAVVAVLALATAVLVVRGFNLSQQGVEALLQGDIDPEAVPEVSAIISSTLINLIAIFLFTMVGAALFSRTLLTEPIAQLVRGTRELASGNLGVTLPVTSSSELGMLAENFNQMSLALAESRDLLEQRVSERTSDLQALLELSNSTALSLELLPLLAEILERLGDAVGAEAVTVFETTPDGLLAEVAHRGERRHRDSDTAAAALAGRSAQHGTADGALLTLPLVVRDTAVGALQLEHRSELHFNEDRTRLATAFANQVAVALENTHLYEQALEKAAYDERQHLARELHDSVSQALYAILLGTHTAQRQLERSPAKASEALHYVESLAQAGIAEMRALIFELRPESLEEEGLVGVLRKQLDAMEHRHGLEISMRLPDEPDLPFASKQVLFRVAQEALHNIVKHARASNVRLELVREGSALRLSVSDDGVGFDPHGDNGAPGHLGLTSMRERLTAVAGNLDIASRPGDGTTVTATLPLRASAAGATGAEGAA
jgi:signal transduction histidine kinase